ncbi:MAG: histidine ammonia-lyase [Candidatus Melainabacteria bacterium]|nr:histidine ammonia-lyase [Candidatus Melainabacteria bacterium]
MMIVLDGDHLTLEQVAQVAYGAPGQPEVTLSPEALSAMAASRQVVEDILEQGKRVYGVNTGFGALSDVSIAVDQVAQLQLNFVRSHAAGTGNLLEEPTVRAMLLLRANALAKGLSGIRPVVVQLLVEMLNRGVHPVVPSQGSLGASGDLAPLAHLALVLIGEGEAFYQGHRLSGAEALAKAGLTPVVLQAKEGLALTNGTQMMTAIGTLTLLQSEALCNIADLAGAMTIEAIKGSHQPLGHDIAEARAHVGHAQSARLMRQLLTGSGIADSHRDCAKVQDPYSLRCIPQVHGAARDAVAYARQVLATEVNSATDNPLVFPDGRVVSQGNFHGEPVAMALDFLAIALAELGSVAERRIDKLMNPVFSGLPAFLVKDAHAGLNSGFMIVHYTAASLVSESKGLCHPAVVDSVPTSNDKEDHVSMGAIAARKAAQVLAHTRWILAAELLAAAQGLAFESVFAPGLGVQAAVAFIRQSIPVLEQDRTLAPEVEQVAGRIENGQLWQAVQQGLAPVEATP